MNLPSSLLRRATFRLRISRSVTSTQAATHFPTTRKYSQEHSSDGYRLQLYNNPLHDLVGEITIPNGSYTLEFARFPVFPSPKEPSTSCLLWGETKAALLAEKFQPSPPSVPSRPGMYFLGPSSVAGTGVFAQEDIECGEAIMVERPFLMAFSHTPDNFGVDPTPLIPMVPEALGLVVAERLSKSEQTDFYRLFSSDNSVWPIMSQNSIPVSEPLPGPYSGPHNVVCRDVSRINHSCTPNVELTWDPTSFTVLIHSNTRISKGEELFRPYRNILEPRSERMELLYQIYDFKCACPSCSLPDDESAKSDTFRRFLLEPRYTL
ncbi:hypothetical protein DFH08DRAFT_3129 [Mycena albidolilacea]|uniref:SET domain-containing protein n=1 Tax=Mycena albidolilacea TaxID=1033008 RepID=A0AAD7F432_9AGAR|nr:hypothetical protein DFH08DRAFT_3129 [Mycena albidolilacea]